MFADDERLTVFKGERQVIPVGKYPSFEIEPAPASNQWATTRAQRPRYNFRCILTTSTTNERKHVRYSGAVATRIIEIMTSPENLQLPVKNESKWDLNFGLSQTFILDSLVESVSWGTAKAGTIRVVEWDWFTLIHETYPDSKWSRLGEGATNPTVLRPKVV